MLTRPFDDSSSDYGPDFTAEEEDLVNELLAKVTSEQPAVPPTSDRRPGPPRPPQSQSPHQPVATVADIEDYEDRSRARSPKVRGREKLASPRSRKTLFQLSSPHASRGSGQVSWNAGTAHGMVSSWFLFYSLVYGN